MKFLLVIFLVAAASAAPQNRQDAQILRYDSNNAGLDSYNFVWELSDGTKHEEQGQLKDQGTENEGYVVRGEYGWVGPDGVEYLITYVADENGFQPQIQQGPGGAVPSAVVASLLGFPVERTNLKMKLLVFLCLVAVAAAAPPPSYTRTNSVDAEVRSYENDNDGLGGYRYYFEQTDGTKQEQKAEVRNAGREDQYLAITGFYSWFSPNGVEYIVKYTADQDGYNSEIEEGPGGAPPALVASLLG
ncbi:larval cuticle protein LCP-30 [Bicyclus anynana]|uniref:Larval cuticle protein LCP-30 n=1 Tax=Bicyclus anynana TaxID=110368 RepID=A0A6J1NWG7_BICAN|nr:larval cuticle protein LCP-30 [Bicyclus anynana]